MEAGSLVLIQAGMKLGSKPRSCAPWPRSTAASETWSISLLWTLAASIGRDTWVVGGPIGWEAPNGDGPGMGGGDWGAANGSWPSFGSSGAGGCGATSNGATADAKGEAPAGAWGEAGMGKENGLAGGGDIGWAGAKGDAVAANGEGASGTAASSGSLGG